MCGIAGFLGFEGILDSPVEVLRRMTGAIVHRGPDAEGHWVDLDLAVGLGHRRLSIIDLTPAGAQPMRSLSGAWVMVFNGEIYNHLELREELRLAGHSVGWRGHSDTETLLACFEAWGVKATLERSVGMFAIALWSERSRQLILARDRFGEKPLFYGWLGPAQRTLVFGSELRVFDQHPAFVPRVDRSALTRFMKHMCVSGNASIAKGVFKVPPGAMVVASLACPGKVEISPYWSLDAQSSSTTEAFDASSDDQSAVAILDRLLRQTIRGQMLSDVPLGAFLSGGVDSSAVVAVMQAVSTRPVKTFSIGFSEKEFDEAGYAKQVAASIGTDHTEFYVSAATARSVIPELGSIYDEPFADSSQIPTILVSRLARRSVTVALSGDGGDEVFGGYNRYLIAHSIWPKLKRIPVPARRMVSSALLTLSPSQLEWLGHRLNLASKWAGVAAKIQKGARVLSARSTEDLYRKLTTTWMERVVLDGPDDFEFDPAQGPAPGQAGDANWMMAADLLHYLPSDILVKVDRASMSTSLETRAPYLDHRIVEWARTLPLHLKLRKGGDGYKTKWLLRQVLYRYVPEALIERPKMGFGIPLAQWLRGPLAEWADALLDDVVLRQEGFFDANLIRKRWLEHRGGARDWEHHLWCVLMFQSWLSSERGRRYS